MVLLNHVYVDVFGESRHRLVVRLVSDCVFDVLLVEILGFVNGLVEDQDLCGPVNYGVGFP